MLPINQRLFQTIYITYPSIEEQEETAKDLQPCSRSSIRWRATRWPARGFLLFLLRDVRFCICCLLVGLLVRRIRHVVRGLGVGER